ncbi:MAG TPA: glucosaminidase domain-containing protein [Chitinophagales bacterium]|nr:glucosaminidase domain-containing protein [Chitinophagales bacterium]
MAFACGVVAQDSYTNHAQDYIDRYKDIAIAEMQRTRVPASIKLAQGLLESGFGQSELAMKANNHFGIKCHSGWTGPSMTYDDDAKNECFRKYNNAEESFRDHSDFLRTRERYAFLFEYQPTDYKKWANGLKQAGYATNPRYPDLLIQSIEKYNLTQYDIYGSFVADNSTNPSNKTSNKAKHERNKRKIKNAIDDVAAAVAPQDKTAVAGVTYVNGLKAVRLTQEETITQIGRRYDIGADRVLRYNELNQVESLPAGTLVYLQPKRRNAQTMYHVVQPGESMYAISQQHGVRLSFLYTKNLMEQGTQPAAGEVVYLKDKRSTRPLLRGQETKPVNVTPSAEIAHIDTRVATAPSGNDLSPRYAKPMPTDPLFPSANSSGVATQPSEATPELELQPVQHDPSVSIAPESSVEYITSTETEGVDYHTVKPKETLYGIARAYGLTVNQLMEYNALGSDVISSGTRLRIRR